jgi:hypothetical protein
VTGQADKAKVKVDRLVHCARCGATHEDIVFVRFMVPIRAFGVELYSHWAKCPTSGDPILMVAEAQMVDPQL